MVLFCHTLRFLMRGTRKDQAFRNFRPHDSHGEDPSVDDPHRDSQKPQVESEISVLQDNGGNLYLKNEDKEFKIAKDDFVSTTNSLSSIRELYKLFYYVKAAHETKMEFLRKRNDVKKRVYDPEDRIKAQTETVKKLINPEMNEIERFNSYIRYSSNGALTNLKLKDYDVEYGLNRLIARDILGKKINVDYTSISFHLTSKFTREFFNAIAEFRDVHGQDTTLAMNSMDDLISNFETFGYFEKGFSEMISAVAETLPKHVEEYTENDFLTAKYLFDFAHKIYPYDKSSMSPKLNADLKLLTQNLVYGASRQMPNDGRVNYLKCGQMTELEAEFLRSEIRQHQH